LSVYQSTPFGICWIVFITTFIIINIIVINIVFRVAEIETYCSTTLDDDEEN